MLPKTMCAAVFLAPGVIELRELPTPEPGVGELLVRVSTALTCGTDVKTYRRGHPKFPPPFVFGHEFAGEVVAVGAGVENFHPGQRITANVFAECGECFYCRRGQGNLCEHLVYNFGAFAEYMLLPRSIVRLNTFEIPPHLSDAEAAMLEPLVTVVHGQALIDIRPGESVAIIGAGGPIGLLHQQLALRAGAETLIALGHSDLRLNKALAMGATHVINTHEVDAIQAIHDQTGGRGADVVIECAGNKPAWETAVGAARKGGRVLWFGGLPGGACVELDAAKIHYGELALYGVHGGTAQDARAAFDLLCSGAVQTSPLISQVFPLELVESALQQMMAGRIIKGAIQMLKIV